jgi:hypothetical protein
MGRKGMCGLWQKNAEYISEILFQGALLTHPGIDLETTLIP